MVDLGTGCEIADLFRAEHAVLHEVYGGKTVGTVVYRLIGFDADTIGKYVWSELGELCEVQDILSSVGRGA